jgi:ABC-2 type transport system permease protein
MTSSTIAPVDRDALAPALPRAHTDRAIFWRTFRQVRTGALVVAVGFGLSAASTALSYASAYPTEELRQEAVAIVGNDVGLAILLGPIASIDTVGGYLVYKNFVFLTTIGAIWALLAATKVLRGNEEAGRWQLLLAGSTRPARATAAALAALAAAVGVVFVGLTLCTLLAARDPELELGLWSSVVYGASLALVPAVFVAVGALTSQVSRSRRQASGIGLAVVAAAFVLRMIADTGPGARWVAWLTPFGWTELVAPFTQDRLTPIGLGLVVTVVLGAAASWLASRRDVGAGLVGSNDRSEIRRFGLGSPFGLSVRLERGVVIAWWIGAAVLGFTMGLFAAVTTVSLPESLRDPLANFGVSGAFVDQFLGVVFLILAGVVALVSAGQLGAAAAEELSGRLVHVVAGPTRRTAWFAGRLVIAASATAVAALLTAVGIWIGGRIRGVELDLASVLGAGLNIIPTALVALGIGSVALAIAPRAAATTVYVVVTWSIFVDLVAALVPSVSWLGRTSLFDTMALAPGETPVVSTLVVTTVVALALSASATAIFARRDLQV